MWNLTKQDHLERYMYLYKDWELPTWSMVIDHYKMKFKYVDVWQWNYSCKCCIFCGFRFCFNHSSHSFSCTLFLLLEISVQYFFRFSKDSNVNNKNVFFKSCYGNFFQILLQNLREFTQTQYIALSLCILFIFLLFTILFHSSG